MKKKHNDKPLKLFNISQFWQPHSSLKRYRRKIRRRLLTSRRSWVTAEILVVTVTVKPR